MRNDCGVVTGNKTLITVKPVNRTHQKNVNNNCYMQGDRPVGAPYVLRFLTVHPLSGIDGSSKTVKPEPSHTTKMRGRN